MMKMTSSLSVAAFGALLLAVASAAPAQDNSSAGTAPPPPPVVGNPQLRDFQLTPQRTIVTQPAPAPVVVAPPPVTAQPQRTTPARPAEARPTQAPPRQQAPTAQPPAHRAGADDAARARAGRPRRRRSKRRPRRPRRAIGRRRPLALRDPGRGARFAGLRLPSPAPARARPRKRLRKPRSPSPNRRAPRPDPVPRPWLELSLKAERASATLTETIVQFELEMSNTGKSPARNLGSTSRCSTPAPSRTRRSAPSSAPPGARATKLNLPGIGPESTGVIRGEVAMPRDEMRAVVLDDKYLFIPVIAVNALYDWGEGRTGQTSKSYVVGRELEQPSAKMGAFRVDQGPRIWRTIGQRQHTLAKRV